VKARIDQFGLVAAPLKPEELGAHVRAQAVIYRDAVRELNLTME